MDPIGHGGATSLADSTRLEAGDVDGDDSDVDDCEGENGHRYIYDNEPNDFDNDTFATLSKYQSQPIESGTTLSRNFDHLSSDPVTSREITADIARERDWRWRQGSDTNLSISIFPQDPFASHRPLPTPQPLSSSPSSHPSSVSCPLFNRLSRRYSDDYSNRSSGRAYRYGYDHLRLGRRSPSPAQKLTRMMSDMFLYGEDDGEILGEGDDAGAESGGVEGASHAEVDEEESKDETGKEIVDGVL